MKFENIKIIITKGIINEDNKNGEKHFLHVLRIFLHTKHKIEDDKKKQKKLKKLL